MDSTFKEAKSSSILSGEMLMLSLMYCKQAGLILHRCLSLESWQLLHLPHLLVLHVWHLKYEITGFNLVNSLVKITKPTTCHTDAHSFSFLVQARTGKFGEGLPIFCQILTDEDAAICQDKSLMAICNS